MTGRVAEPGLVATAPGMGAICHTINPRLHPDDIAYIINHAQDKILFVDASFAPLISAIAPQIAENVKTVVMLTASENMPEMTLATGMTMACYDQITDAAHAIRRAGAPAPVLFRPPYGSFNRETLSLLHAQRLLMVLWGVDTSDYTRPGPAKIIFTALSGAAPGAIILMHDGGGDRSQTVAALPRIITRLRQRGFHLVTVSQLVGDDPPPRGQPAPQSLSGTP